MRKSKQLLFDIDNEIEVAKFVSLINNTKLTYEQIAGMYGYKSKSVVYNMINKLNISRPDRQIIRDKLYSSYENTNINTVTALAPLKYSPTVRVIRCGTRNNIHYYVPELNKLVTEQSLEKVLNKIGIKLYEWECRWFLNLDKDFISTELWANRVIDVFYSDRKENTKLYIKNHLLLDPSFKFDFLMIREDLISDIKSICSSKKSLDSVFDNIDLDSLPLCIKNITEPFKILDKDGNIFFTSYFKFIIRGYNPFVHTSKLKTTEQFIKESENKFGKGHFEILSSYVGRSDLITIKCNNCGSIFNTTPAKHLSSIWGCCEKCCNKSISSIRSFTKEEFQDKIDSIYGIGKYKCISEYKNMKTLVTLINLETGTIFSQDPENILYHAIIEPTDCKKSNGEYLTKLWLSNNNIKFSEQVKISNIEGRSSGSCVIIDFIIEFNKKQIWIEYNGKQHYIYSSRFNNFSLEGLEQQKIRDNNVKRYCIDNNIDFIEIPYVLSSYKSISIFLNKVILENTDPTTIIDYDKINDGCSTIKSIDKLDIF